MNSEAMLENLHIPISEDELQQLIDIVAESAGEKAKYTLKMGRGRACAHTWLYHMKGRRRIQFSRPYLHDNTHSLIKTIIHEIAHFKECERGRKKAVKNAKRYNNPYCLTDRINYSYQGHKFHTLKFDRIYERLRAKVEKEYGEPL